MPVSRRRFLQASSAAASAYAATGLADGGGLEAQGGDVPAPIRALKPFPGKAIADCRRRAAGADREGATADGRARHGRDRARTGHEHVVLRQRALGPERAPVPAGHPREGRAGVRVARLRGAARARDHEVHATTCACGRKTRTGARVVAGILKDRGVATGKVGVEERVRFFIADGLRAAAPRVAVRARHAGHRRMPHDQVARPRSR